MLPKAVTTMNLINVAGFQRNALPFCQAIRAIGWCSGSQVTFGKCQMTCCCIYPAIMDYVGSCFKIVLMLISSSSLLSVYAMDVEILF